MVSLSQCSVPVLVCIEVTIGRILPYHRLLVCGTMLIPRILLIQSVSMFKLDAGQRQLED